jgi:hypothetical protein
MWNVAFSNAVASAYQLANAGTGLLKLTGQWSFPTNGTNGSQFLVNATNAPIELDGYIHGSGNSNGTYTFICFQGGPTTAATNKITITGATNDFRDFEVSNVVLNYNSLAPAGTPCAIGAGTNILLGGGSGGNANWPNTGSQGCSLQYVGPSGTLSHNIQINCTASQCYWGIENAGTNTTLTISNNIFWNPLTNIFTGFYPRYLFLNVNNAATNTVYSAIPDPGIVVAGTPIGVMVTASAPVGSVINNGGVLQLMNPTNTFAGGVQIPYARTLQALTLADIGQPSSIGTGTNPGAMITPAITLTGINLGSTDSQRGGALSYIGTNNTSSNQKITVLGSATGLACSGTIRNDSPNGSSLHLTDTGIWNLQSVMPLCLAVLGGTSTATNTMDSAMPDVGPTNVGSLMVNGSAWRITATQTYTGTTTVQNATLIMNGTIAAGAGATVENGGVLTGTGTINEFVNVMAGGTIGAGDGAIGTLTINSNVTNAGTVFMKLNKTAGTNDVLALGANAMTYGGTLSVSNLAGTLANHDSFHLFVAGSYSGTFTNIDPATPGAGLVWDLSSLPTNGILKVASGAVPSSPKITSFSVTGTNVNMSGTNGPPNGSYHVIGSTNISLSLSLWTNVTSSSFDNNGNFSLTITNAVLPGVTRQFYSLEVP